MSHLTFYEKVYEIVAQIPKGNVMTYGQIAALAGKPNASRAVGHALRVCPEKLELPCHRVVNTRGYLSGGKAFDGMEIQKQLLVQEGIKVSEDYCIDLERYLSWNQQICGK